MSYYAHRNTFPVIDEPYKFNSDNLTEAGRHFMLEDLFNAALPMRLPREREARLAADADTVFEKKYTRYEDKAIDYADSNNKNIKVTTKKTVNHIGTKNRVVKKEFSKHRNIKKYNVRTSF